MLFKAVVILLTLNHALATLPPPDTSCDYEHKIKRGKVYELKSPGWPNFYKKERVCRWILDCPLSYVCRIKCHEFAVPESKDCAADRMLISTEGSNWLLDAGAFCGVRVIDTKSANYRLTIGFVSTGLNPGSRFRCQVVPELRP